MPKFKYYTIPEAIQTVADFIVADIRAGREHDDSPTTIRCTINDLLDQHAKDGYRVRHGYNQKGAIKKVHKSVIEKLGIHR